MKLPTFEDGTPLVNFNGDEIMSELLKPSPIKEFVGTKAKEVIENAARSMANFKVVPGGKNEEPENDELDDDELDDDELDDDELDDDEPEYTEQDAIDTAEDYAIIIDAINHLTLPVLYFFVEFDTADRQIIKAHKRAFENAYAGGLENVGDDDEVNSVYSRWCAFKEDCEGVPMNKDEEAFLIRPLSRYAKKHKKRNSLGVAITAAMLKIYTVRLTPLFSKYF